MAPEYAFFMPDTELTSDITMDHDRPWPGDPPPQSAMQSMSTADLLSRQGMGHPSYSSENSPTHMTGGYDEQSQNMPGSSYLLQHDLEEGTSRDSPLSAAAVAQKAKRNRNALSCAECRRLKLKCNRQWPCGSCVKRKLAHLCPDETLKEIRPSRTKEVTALQERIRDLEIQLAQAKSAQFLSRGTQQPQEIASVLRAPTERVEQHPNISDVAEVMGTLMIGEDGSSRYLGKSAANALFHEQGTDAEDLSTESEYDSEDDATDNGATRMNGMGFPLTSAKMYEARDFQAQLPPLSEAQHLAAAYYDNCAFMFEPLKRDRFEQHLRDAYNLQDDTSRYSHPHERHHGFMEIPLEHLALVFIVLAVGVLFDLDAELKDPRTFKYHSIAQTCLTSAKFLNVPSMASIQTLHIMATWHLSLHSQTGAFRAWPLLGLAGRIVLSTGLHRDGSIWAIPEPALTLRRNLFWEYLVYDRLQSMILGRPYMINSKHFDTLMPEAPAGVSTDGEALEFHRAKWDLAVLMGDMQDDVFSIGRPGYDTILKHDRRFRAFKEALPHWLRFDPNASLPASAPAPHTREYRQLLQIHTITIKTHECMLFLHRVAFAQSLEHYSAEPLRSPWAQSVVSLCLEASRTLIAVARAAYALYPRLAARWWYIAVHVFGAGVCFSAVCIKAPNSALAQLAWSELCDAVALLENVSEEGVHARELGPRLRKLRGQAQAKLESHERSQSSLNHHADVKLEHGFGAHSAGPSESGPSSKSEDEDLAVLGTATRVLEANFRPHQHSSRGAGSSAGNSVATKSPVGPHLQAGGGSGLTTISGSQAAARTGASHSNEETPSSSSNTSDHATNVMQVYQNLDPSLANLLANISNTQPGENSASFPQLAADFGRQNPQHHQQERHAQHSGQMSHQAAKQARLQQHQANQRAALDLTGVSMTSHLPPYMNPNLQQPPTRTPDYNSGSSPGREYFGEFPVYNDTIAPFTSALSPPPPGPPNQPLPFGVQQRQTPSSGEEASSSWMDMFQTERANTVFERNDQQQQQPSPSQLRFMQQHQQSPFPSPQQQHQHILQQQQQQQQQQAPQQYYSPSSGPQRQHPQYGHRHQPMQPPSQLQHPQYGVTAQQHQQMRQQDQQQRQQQAAQNAQQSGYRMYDELLSTLNYPDRQMQG